jgi:hypothetical protein
MKTTLTVSIAASAFAAATAAWAGADSVNVKSALPLGTSSGERPLFPSAPYPGYIAYSGYSGALPGPNCYWTGFPVYDADRNVVGWRGRPVAVCPQVKVSADAAGN